MEKIEKGRAAIVGGGNMGADIALLFAAGDWPVDVVEPSAAARAAIPERLARGSEQLGAKLQPDGVEIHASLDGVPWRDVTIVVECIPEKLEPKRELFARLEQLARPDAVLTSNSSAFPISEIARGLRTRERMAGLHFFLPAHLVPLVEVIRSEHTRPGLPEQLADLMRSLGRVPVQVRKDIPGFLANRLQHAMAREAYALIDAGVATPEDIDVAVRFGFGFRFLAAGPCLQRDHAGLDVHAAAAATMYPTLAANTIPSRTLTDKVARGELGMKTGKGFFEWDAESIRREKARYESRLRAALEVLKEDL
jgi:3-hydroxybutyryl-CoA dehydrogenase